LRGWALSFICVIYLELIDWICLFHANFLFSMNRDLVKKRPLVTILFSSSLILCRFSLAWYQLHWSHLDCNI
jgi:hypothetical protein